MQICGGRHGGGFEGASTSRTNVYDRRYTEYKDRLRAEEIQNQRDADNNTLQVTEQGLLRRTSLMPGNMIEGDIILKYREAKTYVVEVPIDGYVHILQLHLTPK